MNTTALQRPEALPQIRCVECNSHARISERQRRFYISEKRDYTCSTCRPRKYPVQTSSADKAFWLERFSIDEIRDMAIAIWGTP